MTTKEELRKEFAETIEETAKEVIKELKIQAFKVKMVLDEAGSELTLEEIQDILAEQQLEAAKIVRERLRIKQIKD
jgi:citrate lyase gamma subunit